MFAPIFSIAHAEASVFRRYPRLLLSAVFVVLLPSLYMVIYLSSVWDPQSRLGTLPVALVNLDEGIRVRDMSVNVGREVAQTLTDKHSFDFRPLQDEQEARKLVRNGTLAFALIIPADFSSNAIPGREAGGGKLVVYSSEGNNFETTAIARHFADQLGRDVNETLNERRWQLVLSNAAGSQHSVEQLRLAVEKLRGGAKELAGGAAQTSSGARQANAGSAQLSEGVNQLTAGFKQVAAGLRTMDARRPSNADLNRLRSGADELVAGHAELGKGLGELSTGAQRLHKNVTAFRDEAKDTFLMPGRVVEALEQLHEGTEQLDAGAVAARDGQLKLQEGAKSLNAGIGTLTNGVRTMGTAVRTAVTKLPPDAQLDELDRGAANMTSAMTALADGTQRVRAGTDRLQDGLDLLAQALPTATDAPEGSAQGLANSVQPVVEIDAVVVNSGSGFAANVIPAALWLGAGIAIFLINVRVLPRTAQRASRTTKLLGKLVVPLVIVGLQALLVLLTARYVLEVPVRHPLPFAVTLVVAAGTFLCIMVALSRAFGDAGKALALVFLAIQLSSSGGVLPVELSGSLFAQISPYLPLTWLVQAMKATLFGAFDSAWVVPVSKVAAAGALAFVACICIGEWRYARPGAMRPAVEF